MKTNTTIIDMENDALAAGYDNQQPILERWANSNGYTENITGDACQGDEICCLVGVFGGSYRKPTLEGFKLLIGVIIKESYGSQKQQHTFTLQLQDGSKKRIKGRNLYRHGTYAKPRNTEEREAILHEKHERGSTARQQRAERVSQLY